jgi:hypothetical protein
MLVKPTALSEMTGFAVHLSVVLHGFSAPNQFGFALDRNPKTEIPHLTTWQSYFTCNSASECQRPPASGRVGVCVAVITTAVWSQEWRSAIAKLERRSRVANALRPFSIVVLKKPRKLINNGQL